MPQPKSLPKDRYTRQRAARATRRHLASLTPSTSHPQLQSAFFTLLPAEIRFTIYQHVLSQQNDHSRPIDIHSISPLYRPLHTYHSKIDSALLLTCRLVYVEAHQIPLRSATHHFRYLGSTSWLYNGDIWLHHVTSQRGAELYHLHDNLVALKASNFQKFLLQHLHWRRITWTICAYLLPPLLAELKERQRLVETLAGLVLPSSCQEVNIEFETREDLLPDWPGLEAQIEACRALVLKRRDGSVLEGDNRFAVRYTWMGSGQARWGTSEDAIWREKMRYVTTRLCWRKRVNRREYMSYDFLNCLGVEGDGEGVVKEVKRLDE
jgi:hypothetical protein